MKDMYVCMCKFKHEHENLNMLVYTSIPQDIIFPCMCAVPATISSFGVFEMLGCFMC